MKIVKITASDMRGAMAKVKADLGPDAVILDTRESGAGVEVFATAEYDANAVATAGVRASAEESSRAEARQFAPRTQEPALEELRSELGRLRKLFENELSEMLWQDRGRRTPELRSAQSLADDLGLSRHAARALIDSAPHEQLCADATTSLQKLLANQLSTNAADILEDGGRIALVGPTGVGKTTTIAKIAARFALRHGRNQVALISTDRFRVGAQEQLFTFGNLLGIPVQAATQADDLVRSLDAFSDRKLVLIDTAGMSQRDLDMAKQLTSLTQSAEDIRVHLVLSAITQEQVIVEALRNFSPLGIEAAIVTKTDEASSLGAILGALLTEKLPLSYLCDGQRVPEDLLVARPGLLVEKALSLAGHNTPELNARLEQAYA